jgi:hypothetical protein
MYIQVSLIGDPGVCVCVCVQIAAARSSCPVSTPMIQRSSLKSRLPLVYIHLCVCMCVCVCVCVCVGGGSGNGGGLVLQFPVPTHLFLSLSFSPTLFPPWHTRSIPPVLRNSLPRDLSLSLVLSGWCSLPLTLQLTLTY